MTVIDPQPISLNPQTLNEEFVQEVMGWMKGKSTEELKRIVHEAHQQPQAYAPEVLEAIQRLLGERGELAYVPTKGEKFPKFFEQKVQVRKPDGSLRIFHSHSELRAAILESELTKDTLIQSLGPLRETWGRKEWRENPEWEPLKTYSFSHFGLATLYTPIQYFITMGCLLGIFLGSQAFVQPILAPGIALKDLSPWIGTVLGWVSLIVLFSLQAILVSRQITKYEIYCFSGFYLFWVLNYVFSAELNLLDSGIERVRLEKVLPILYEFVIGHILIVGLLINGAIFGGPLGTIVGAGTGYIWGRFYPKAPDAEPESVWPLRFGLLYPLGVMLVGWPLMDMWLFPWFSSLLPIPP